MIKSYYGVWLPETDEHISQKFAVHQGWQYQKQKLDEALKYVIPMGVVSPFSPLPVAAAGPVLRN